MNLNETLAGMLGAEPAPAYDSDLNAAFAAADAVHERVNASDRFSLDASLLTLVCRGSDWLATFKSGLHQIDSDGTWWEHPDRCQPCGLAETPAEAVALACIAALEHINREHADDREEV
jgi:hypothetical protein